MRLKFNISKLVYYQVTVLLCITKYNIMPVIVSRNCLQELKIFRVRHLKLEPQDLLDFGPRKSLIFECFPNFHFSIFLRVNQFSNCMTHFCKCDPFLQVGPIFATVTHFFTCDPFLLFCMRLIFASVTHFCKCDSF